MNSGYTHIRCKILSLLVLSCCRSEGGGWLLSVTWLWTPYRPSCFSFLYKSPNLTLNLQISNGASLSAHTSMLNGGWLMMADYWSYIWRFGFSIFNYSWELIFHCTIILMVTILSCTWPGRMADWRDAKLVWWRERARQRRDTETEDEWEARLRQWREITMDRGNLLIFLL